MYRTSHLFSHGSLVVVSRCQLHQHQRLRFSCRYRTPMAFLSELKRHGVSGGASAQLRPSELRLLQQHWPMQEQDQGVSLNWDLLLLLARRDDS